MAGDWVDPNGSSPAPYCPIATNESGSSGTNGNQSRRRFVTTIGPVEKGRRGYRFLPALRAGSQARLRPLRDAR